MLGFSRELRCLSRPLTLADAPACADIHQAAFAHGWKAVDFEVLVAASSTIADGMVGERDDELLAICLSRRAVDEAEILSIAVALPVRRHGLATRLLNDHIENLRNAGVANLFLEVAEDNGAALSLYRKFGFQHVADRPAYYSRPGAPARGALVMRAAI